MSEKRKSMEDDKVYTGTVIWFSNTINFGFIGWEKDGVKQSDAFVHYSDIAMEGYKTIKKDQKVSFSIGKNNRGDPKAINVTVLGE
jgi:CspA family cold shock protein